MCIAAVIVDSVIYYILERRISIDKQLSVHALIAGYMVVFGHVEGQCGFQIVTWKYDYSEPQPFTDQHEISRN
jgi:hypothetical protein